MYMNSIDQNEAQKNRLEPNKIGDFLKMVANSIESNAGKSQQFEMERLALIFFLAKHQPELYDECVRWWNLYHPEYRHEIFLSFWLEFFSLWQKLPNIPATL